MISIFQKLVLAEYPGSFNNIGKYTQKQYNTEKKSYSPHSEFKSEILENNL